LKEPRRNFMANRKKSVILFSLLALAAITVSACTQPYSSVPLETPAANATSLFVSPFPTSDNPMAMVEELSTGTALAETAVALTAGTPLATAVGAEITPGSNATATATLAAACTASVCAAGQTLICPSGSTCSGGCGMVCTANTPTPTATLAQSSAGSSGGIGQSCTSPYTLQKGEFPYCIARRCDVDPAELLGLNKLASGEIYYPNMTLNLPQSGKPFPGTRALRSHPDTYTVADASLTVYGIACAYGDVDPAAIVQANSGLSLASALTVGQKINIP
jgi:LysM repeat protein